MLRRGELNALHALHAHYTGCRSSSLDGSIALLLVLLCIAGLLSAVSVLQGSSVGQTAHVGG